MLKDLLNRRFACKSFDSSKPVSEEDLKDIMDTTRLSPSSYGLQSWIFIAVTNPELRQKLSSACYGQAQPKEAPVVVVMCARTDLMGENGMIQSHFNKYKQETGKTDQDIAEYSKRVVDMINGMTPDTIRNWVQKQVYLAGMTLMLAAMEKGIDSCPMEGFNDNDVSRVLELPPQLQPTLIIPLGYKNMEQPKKIRHDYEKVIAVKR